MAHGITQLDHVDLQSDRRSDTENYQSHRNLEEQELQCVAARHL